jgi:hypothetical protein
VTTHGWSHAEEALIVVTAAQARFAADSPQQP